MTTERNQRKSLPRSCRERQNGQNHHGFSRNSKDSP